MFQKNDSTDVQRLALDFVGGGDSELFRAQYAGAALAQKLPPPGCLESPQLQGSVHFAKADC